jgi:hypothetical protein
MKKEFGGHKYELRGEYTSKREANDLAKAWKGTGSAWARVETIQQEGRPVYRVWMCPKPRSKMGW